MKNWQRYIIKIDTKTLKDSRWNIDRAEIDDDWYIGISESQLVRWIEEIKRDRPKKKRGTKIRMRDLIAVVMRSEEDYDRANHGFSVGGIRFRRLLGTPGGLKNSTVLYIDERLYPEIWERITNGRDPEQKLVPAKLEAYQALTCSGSVPIPRPRVIVVRDCYTAFRETVTAIKAYAKGKDPIIAEEADFAVEHDNSDGCGLMSPDYARRVNLALHHKDEPISAITIRYAWTKGVTACFDFVEFAGRIAERYEVTDIWGDVRDVRDADMILTESMVKLWNAYPNMETWLDCSERNGYRFAATKASALELESERTSNYQFIQGFDLSDDDIRDLCAPTVDYLKDVQGGDVRKSILFKGGINLTAESVTETIAEKETTDNSTWEAIALMIDHDAISDPHIRYSLKHDTERKIEEAAMGKLLLNANYSIIVGDLYALCQSMFGLPVTGLLKAGEIFNEFWRMQGAGKVAVFRAPMTQMAQTCIREINNEDDAIYWFRFCQTITILNAWDSTSERLSGADFDGDIAYTTDNPIILRNVRDVPRLAPVQEKPEKMIVRERDIIAANKKAFSANVGTICNRITSMFDVQAGLIPHSPLWDILDKRISSGQLFIQDAVDSCKGIDPAIMPVRWYNQKAKDITDEDAAICAAKKPYFMVYNYDTTRDDLRSYNAKANSKAILKFWHMNIESVEDLQRIENPPEEVKSFLESYMKNCPVTMGDCTINRIARHIERQFPEYRAQYRQSPFDYSRYQFGITYTETEYKKIKSKYLDYNHAVKTYKETAPEDTDKVERRKQLSDLFEKFLADCLDAVDGDEKKLNDIVVDICYTEKKQKYFAWRLCGKTMILAMLAKNNNMITIPVPDEAGDIEFKGKRFTEVTHELHI